jgi:signal transduction histidine kinase
MLKVLGNDGLAAFNDPKGQFVFKDTYAYVMKCPSEMAAHPFAMAELKGIDLRKFAHTEATCKMAESPKGGWLEYSWPKPGETAPSRKITFVIGIKDTPYAIAAGIFDENSSVDELNKTLR